jgi:hypothetical protein
MFRYLNALQMGKVKADMKAKLALATGVSQPIVFAEEAEFAAEGVVVDVYGDFRGRFALFVRMRNLLLRGRIRAHVISGIEFMMFVFIVGPVLNQVIAVTLVAAALMIAFEMLLIYKLWTATRSFARRMRAVVPVQPTGSEDAVEQSDVAQGAEAALGI